MSEKIPLMVRKWKHLADNWESWESWVSKQLKADPSLEYGAFEKGCYFFYGTLMDPSRLAKVLRLPDGEQPKLRPAMPEGYHIKLWGQYPALLDGPRGHEVYGVAYEVQLQEHLDRLIAYETHKYRLRPCSIRFLDIDDEDNEIIGDTFAWNGKLEELSEGEFSLEEWLKQKEGRPK